MTLDYEKLIEIVSRNSLCSTKRLNNLIQLAQLVNEQKIPGDFVECGTFKGGSAALLSKHMTPNRHLWIYDGFRGLPETTTPDGIEAKQWVGMFKASADDVKYIMETVKTDCSQYTIVEGDFEKTFSESLPEHVALLHCDADWYRSVLLVLETFYPLIPKGGCVILDDFGFLEGCREAFYDFCFQHQEKPLLERLGTTQAFWIKGKSHNR
jgi:O-methyltransferase